MNRIESQLEKIKQSGKIGLMTHVIVGYPTVEKTKELVMALAEGGSDFIELQIPFSDPIADGPTIMQASDVALKNGVTAKVAMQALAELSEKLTIPLLFMCYYNSIYSYGIKNFCKDAAAAGASGLIVPDIPPEEEAYEQFEQQVTTSGLYLIRVISPASSSKRLQKNAELAKGFVYCVSRYGVTGAKNVLAPELSAYLERVSSHVHLPKAVGFGISTKEQVRALQGSAEVAVVGSAIVEKVKNGAGMDHIQNYVAELVD